MAIHSNGYTSNDVESLLTHDDMGIRNFILNKCLQSICGCGISKLKSSSVLLLLWLVSEACQTF